MIAWTEALAWIERNVSACDPERVPVAAACGRVLATAVPAQREAKRAGIDGYAVWAAATEGASDYAPLPLAAHAVVAGAALPPETDAVLPPHLFEAGCALGSVPPGDGVAVADLFTLAAGTLLRAPHLAVLAQRSKTEVTAVRTPVVRLRVAGPKAGPDALLPMLGALVMQAGGRVGEGAPDLVVHAGRSGLGADDDGIAEFGSVVAHGVRIRPGETTALGVIANTPALLLPGDPLACFLTFALLVAPALRRLAGRPDSEPLPALLARKIVSSLGQADIIPVRLRDGVAIPLPPLLSQAAEADGLVLAPEGSEGYPAGAPVAIYALP